MSDPFTGISFPPPGGPYASADDLVLISDLVEVDLRIDRWKRNGAALRIRVKALSFAQQEKIDRAALIKVDGQLVRSESRFACLTLKEAVIVPTLTDAQAAQMAAHNPAIISAIVSFVMLLNNLDQEVIDGLVENEIGAGAGDDAQSDGSDSGPALDAYDPESIEWGERAGVAEPVSA